MRMQNKMVKNKLKHICAVALVVVITVGGLWCASNVTERKESTFKYGPFFEEEENYDVLFMGNSHVLNGILPMELWRDYGIVSYNFGGHGNQLAITYWSLVNALDYTTPQLVVVDCYFLGDNKKTSDYIELTHFSFDAFPLTENKVRAINDLWADNPHVSEKQKTDFLWKFSTYHGRWSQLEAEDLCPNYYTTEKGAEIRVAVSAPEKTTKIAPSQKSDDNTLGVVYLKKIIELCQERNIDIMLTYLPFPASETEQMEANRANDIANEYDITYLNFLDMEQIVDFGVDCYDPVSHLNGSGGKKISAYLGQYIQDNYQIMDHRDDPTYASWHNDYQEYVEHKMQLLRDETAIENYLMLLRDKDTTCQIYIRADSCLLDNMLIQNLLKNIASEKELPMLSLALAERQNYYLEVNGSTGMVEEDFFWNGNSIIQSSDLKNQADAWVVAMDSEGNVTDEVFFQCESQTNSAAVRMEEQQ